MASLVVVVVVLAVVALHLDILVLTALTTGHALVVDSDEVSFAVAYLLADIVLTLDLSQLCSRTGYDQFAFAVNFDVIRLADTYLGADAGLALSLNLTVFSASLDQLALRSD